MTKSVAVEIAQMSSDINYLKGDVSDIKRDIAEIKENYLTKEDFNIQFTPIQKWVVGGLTFIATAVLGAGITLILRRQP